MGALISKRAESATVVRSGSATVVDPSPRTNLPVPATPSGASQLPQQHQKLLDALKPLPAIRDTQTNVKQIDEIVGLTQTLRKLDFNQLDDAAAQLELKDGVNPNQASDSVTRLRQFLLVSHATSEQVQKIIGGKIPAGEPTSRQGYLRTVSEVFPRPEITPEILKKEWGEMCAEHEEIHAIVHTPRTASLKRCHDQMLKKCRSSIHERLLTDKVKVAWKTEHAQNFTLLSSIEARGPMARALAENDRRYAASTYALLDAIQSRVQESFAMSPDENPHRGEDHEGRFYRNLEGYGSLALDDTRWKTLEKPDNTGFKGLTAFSATRPIRCRDNFEAQGWKAQVETGIYERVNDSDIVAFDNLPTSDLGFHHGIVSGDQLNANGTSANSVIYPPFTLFRLRKVYKPGEWTAPDGLTPNCRLLVVTATYKFPEPAAACETQDTSKWCETAELLSYGSRSTFIRGLTDVLDRPTLTMFDEWNRPISWKDRRGIKYTCAEEWDYAINAAKMKEHCTPGIRDKNNDGKTPDKFLEEINKDIMEFFVFHGDKITVDEDGKEVLAENKHALMNKEEVLSVRLYTGPGFQPINDFLRQIEKLSGPMRVAVAKSPAFSFSATISRLCHAIRKLAAISPPLQNQKLYRGVRGDLPRTFWAEDEQGMICAVDGGFASTSKKQLTVEKYLGRGNNIMWEIKTEPESDAGYHCGADVSKLSQFAEEEEVLFPPCTLFEVCKKPQETLNQETFKQFDTNGDGVLDAEETKELVKHLQFGGIQHRKSQPSKQTSKDLPPIQPPPHALQQSRSRSSVRLKQMKDNCAVEEKTAEDDAEKKYEIITVKAYFV